MSPVESQFHVPPFPPFPSAERYVRLGSQDEALQRLCRAVDAWEAISLVIGPPGMGKSLICRMLKNHFARKREVIVFGDAMLESPASLQRHLLSRLDRIRGISAAATDRQDPQLAIIDRIANSSKEFAGLLLLVDEAQELSPEVLDTIRILTNTMTNDGRPRVSAVLAGGPKLDETLSLPSLEALVQRVATRCYVHPLSSDETVQYVREVLRRCGGWDESQIEESAIRSIHRACSGVPRLVNQLMTASIEYALSKGKKQVTGQTVDQAWAILQQLPSPIIDEPELSRPTFDVEYGPLQDDDDLVSEPVASFEPHEPACEPTEGSIFDRGASIVDDDFDMLEIEPCDEPMTLMEMDCQTIGNFENMPSQFADFQIDSLQCDPMPFDVEGVSHSEAIGACGSSNDDLFGEFDEEESVENAAPALSFNENDSLRRPSEDLEESLHREILSLRGAASAPVLWMEDGDSGDPIVDDRDLLVIEDDVEVDGVAVSNEVERIDRPGKPVAVDFQAMLAKMRSPSK
ncbi:ExeA family protein [Neorhodopirellula pilleata]|uniref:ORC1/DEAH AAA+ ATPase domain-containing protein n=1 Tax=Neorhodopirellula pilleata TaxID=2714738 RepID=A0A5C6AB22_9BACT|nr:hypothetical protein Pla100_29810 [Neorhodopirellula pilleata]